MKRTETNLFSIRKLDEYAQKKAWQDWLRFWSYPLQNEVHYSTESFKSWEMDVLLEAEGLTGSKLKDFLKERISKDHYHFTGYYLDEVFLDPIINFLNSECEEANLETLLDRAHARAKAVVAADEEFMSSFDQFKDYCEYNEWLFRESGEIEL